MPKRLNRDPNGEWKAIVLSYDYIFSLSTEKCAYCLTEQQAMALVQISEYLAWQTRWIDAADGKDNDKLAAFAAGIQDILMSGCCGDETNEFPTRYNEDGILEIQYEPDGPWVRAPDQGPRFNGTLLSPLVPIEGQDMKCIGAENVVKWFEQATSETVDIMDVSGSVAAILAGIGAIIVLWIGTTVTFGVALTPLLIGLASALAFTTGSAFAAAMTEEVYERLRCNIYCHISADGSFSEAAWQQIKIQVGEEETGIAYKFIFDNINALGPVGLTNASRSGIAAAANCTSCDCLPYCENGDSFYAGTVNTITDNEDGTFTYNVSSVDNGSGVQYIGWGDRENAGSACCEFLSYVDEVELGPLGGAVQGCGSGDEVPVVPIGGNCYHFFLVFHDAALATPFTADITFTVCEE